jgi:peptidoglycan/LPS O-acetylase OafA/YrhL
MQIFKFPESQGRIYGLDILRAAAIIFVVFGHAIYLSPKIFHSLHKNLTIDGVLIFFVLSGYLIGGIIIREFDNRSINPKLIFNFWIRRWFRTLPAYYLVLLFLFFIGLINDVSSGNDSIWRYFFFVQNLTTVHPDFFAEAWSLSVEEWFYLLLPVTILFSSLFFTVELKKSLPFIALLIIVASVALRIYQFYNFPVITDSIWDLSFRKLVILRLDSIMIGVIGAYIKVYYERIWENFPSASFIVGLSLLVLSKIFEITGLIEINSFYSCVFSFLFQSISVLMVIPYLSNIKLGKGKTYNLITAISQVSYSVYLIHYSVIQELVIQNMTLDFISSNQLIVAKYVLYWLLTFYLSLLMFKYFEAPIMKIRDRFSN